MPEEYCRVLQIYKAKILCVLLEMLYGSVEKGGFRIRKLR